MQETKCNCGRDAVKGDQCAACWLVDPVVDDGGLRDTDTEAASALEAVAAADEDSSSKRNASTSSDYAPEDDESFGADDLFTDYRKGILLAVPMQRLPLPDDATPIDHIVYDDFMVYVGLRAATHELRPAPYPVRKVATRLGLSRTVVHASIKYLRENNLIEPAGFMPPKGERRGTNRYVPVSGEPGILDMTQEDV